MRRVERDSRQMELSQDDPLRLRLRNLAHKQRDLGLIRPNDYCTCGSGKNFKTCCYNKN
jgi:uncharacterized protein YecA (UPF0149 family)